MVLLGDMGTGKTSLVLRFVKGQFYDFQESTIGAAFFSQVLSINEATVKFDIWDTAGQERILSFEPKNGFKNSRDKEKKIVNSIHPTNCGSYVIRGNPNLVMVLVANKIDLEIKREVDVEEGARYAQDNGMFFIETSAKTAHNVNELFYEIGDFIEEVGNSASFAPYGNESTISDSREREEIVLLLDVNILR
ncbi:Ras-related protein Rab5 [Acorus calamus]|uniref:Ras-related protein Rab5 n=1 Tax=Acorus calamus TaxID=4465 RepID=A0AAV9DZK0_ACOCL|nr:Ras-related protein Rab5 [Acorus calamus]